MFQILFYVNFILKFDVKVFAQSKAYNSKNDYNRYVNLIIQGNVLKCLTIEIIITKMEAKN